MAFLLIGYAVLGVVLFPASRRGGEAGKGAYFIAFPFHAFVMPLIEGAGGVSGILRSKTLLVAVFLVVTALGMGDGGDPVTAGVVAAVAVMVLRVVLAGLFELFGE